MPPFDVIYTKSKDVLWRKKMCIYRLPAFAKKMKERENARNPQVVSFGPYHHDEVDLKFLQDYKESVLMNFLYNAMRTLVDFTKAMEKEFDKLQACYQGLDEIWKDKDKFLRLMLIDGCFMLEILRLKHDDTGYRDDIVGYTGYAEHDPILSKHLPYIKRDMLILENQIPLQVLKVLLKVEAERTAKPPMTDKEINKLVFKFWDQEDMPEMETLGLHLLDLYRQIMIRRLCIPSVQQKQSETIPTAWKLHESGVKFRRIKNNNEKISFNKGILKLPLLVVDDSTECTFLNLMAFEHLHVGVGDEITSYMHFMDELIHSDMDVQMLYSEDLIHNAVGSEGALVQILNNITKEFILDTTSNLGGVKKSVKDYNNMRYSKWRAGLMHRYFNNPWSAIALVGAITLLVLNLLQTLYTVPGYYKGSKF